MARGQLRSARRPRDLLLQHLCEPWDPRNPWDATLLVLTASSAAAAGFLLYAGVRVFRGTL